jgi:hypothetical protein
MAPDRQVFAAIVLVLGTGITGPTTRCSHGRSAAVLPPATRCHSAIGNIPPNPYEASRSATLTEAA